MFSGLCDRLVFPPFRTCDMFCRLRVRYFGESDMFLYLSGRFVSLPLTHATRFPAFAKGLFYRLSAHATCFPSLAAGTFSHLLEHMIYFPACKTDSFSRVLATPDKVTKPHFDRELLILYSVRNSNNINYSNQSLASHCQLTVRKSTVPFVQA